MKAAVIHGPWKVSCDNVQDTIIKDGRNINALKRVSPSAAARHLHINILINYQTMYSRERSNWMILLPIVYRFQKLPMVIPCSKRKKTTA